MLMQIIMYAVLLIAAIGALVGWANSKKGATWGQPMTIICAIIAICMGLYLTYRNTSNKGEQEAAKAREQGYISAKIATVAEKVNATHSGKKIVVIVDPSSDLTNDYEITALKEKFNLTDDNFIKPEIPAKAKSGDASGDPGMEMVQPMMEWFSEPDLKKALDGKDYEIVIFKDGWPVHGLAWDKNGKFTKAAYLNGKSIVLLNETPEKNTYFLVKAGVVLASVLPSPTATYDDKPVPKGVKEAFDKRYMLLNKDNVESVREKNPEMLGFEKK